MGLWVSLLKMLISPTLSLYGAWIFFLSFFLLFDHTSGEEAAAPSAVSWRLCDGAEEAISRQKIKTKPIQVRLLTMR